MALFVVAAGISYDINELLVDVVQDTERQLLIALTAVAVPYLFPAAIFIKGLEHEIVAVILEMVGKLSPDALILVHTFISVLFIGKA